MMSELGTARNGKALASLLRLALKSPLAIAEPSSAQSALTLQNADGKIVIAASLLRQAAQSGLLRQVAGKVVATSEGRAHLKRYLAAPDEGFVAQHGELATTLLREEEEERPVRVNLEHSPLSSLARLKDKTGSAFLPPEALSAGERLHADFTRGQLQPRVTQTYEPRLSSKTKGARGGMEALSDSAMAARMRVNRALDALGPELSGVALDVCCFMKGLETVERERQWPARSAKLMLRAALLALDRHYQPPKRNTPMRHWGEDGFRPSL
ncbi:DUF6456 domain-containing protein [Rhizobium sp. L1K21]|uniref:DUF6456 domain-containing protein n=1 Tax=Rhizobium sp. L1K21 TaxID=2954933 RepID=UPI002093CCDE|nr:DUF6456 domain-containing protein [Rhizobium sp. L1K21]MCO6186724.1 DUF6456 domain-containing protein [Rhizobium sp. L1K21]